MRVLHVAAYFAPAFVYGGPPRSILGLCKALRRQGVETLVYTTTANGAEDFPASFNGEQCYEDIPVRYFPRRWPKRFFGVDGLAEMLAANANRFDLLHIHGLWNLTVWAAAEQARKLGLPYLISPRGMLDRGAMDHEAARKFVAWHWAERKNLLGASLLHATSTSEAAAIAAYKLNKPVVTIPNGIEIGPLEAEQRSMPHTHWQSVQADQNMKQVLFLGRIHPIKRLDLLAAAFIRVKANCPEAQLVIAGPDEDGYRKTVEPLFAPVAESVLWAGEVDGEAKAELLTRAAALVLCSDSENFGLSVPEALAAGTPVVATRTTPWAELETVGCGLWVKQNPLAIANAINALLNHPQDAAARGARGAQWVKEKFGWDVVARQMVDCYESVLSQSGVRTDRS
ncbi:MAG: glycosyltransferase [Acidobacteria bacterium]|nr:glycosyltransferase [Acidobacteriota bacterium]